MNSGIKFLLIFLIFPLCQGLFIFAFYISVVAGKEEYINPAAVISILLCVLSDILLFFIIKELAKRERLAENYRLLQKQQEMEEFHLKEMTSVENEYKGMACEISTQLEKMNNFLSVDDPETSMQVLNSLIDEVVEFESRDYCANPVINAIFRYKAIYAQSIKIDFKPELMVPANVGIDDISLCNLFSNLIDNAIEACEQIKEAKDRWIECKVHVSKGIFIINIENSCLEQPVRKQRKNAKIQGYGQKILQDIVDEYQGKLEYKQYKNRYLVNAFLQLREESEQPLI